MALLRGFRMGSAGIFRLIQRVGNSVCAKCASSLAVAWRAGYRRRGNNAFVPHFLDLCGNRDVPNFFSRKLLALLATLVSTPFLLILFRRVKRSRPFNFAPVARQQIDGV